MLGECFREALGDKAGVRRFASGAFPLDEALVEVALDLSGRPFVAYDVPFGEVLPLGDPPFNPEMAEHFWQSFATQAGITLHVTLRAGRNTHHIVEATFKGVSRCLRDAVRVEGAAVPSTKGTLSAAAPRAVVGIPDLGRPRQPANATQWTPGRAAAMRRQVAPLSSDR